jgi:hypothetical protein
MKCKREACQNEVSARDQNRGQVFCSKYCAPFGRLSGEGNTGSIQKRPTFYTKALGEVSAQSKNVEPESVPSGRYSSVYLRQVQSALRTPVDVTPMSRHRESQPSEPQMRVRKESYGLRPTASPIHSEEKRPEIKTGLEPEKFGELGMRETENSTALMKSEGAMPGTQSVVSENRSRDLVEARSLSLDLIDSCANRLMDYLKSIGIECEKNKHSLTPQHINAVANLGKEVGNLAKIKLDAIRLAQTK